MDIDPDFVPLIHAVNKVELEMAKDLLDEADIPHVVDASDQVELLEVIEGPAAEGRQTVYVHEDDLDLAVGVLTEAWGEELMAKRRPR